MTTIVRTFLPILFILKVKWFKFLNSYTPIVQRTPYMGHIVIQTFMISKVYFTGYIIQLNELTVRHDL
jgi:hypothetical protein